MTLRDIFAPRAGRTPRPVIESSVLSRLTRDLHEARSRLAGQGAAEDFLRRSERTLRLAEAALRDRLGLVPTVELVTALEAIYAGSAIGGRWVDSANAPCDDHHPDAHWADYEPDEQARWLESVARIARTALEAVEAHLAPAERVTAEVGA